MGTEWWERYEKEKNEKKSDSVLTSGPPNHINPVFYHRIDNWNYPKSWGNSSFWIEGTNLKILPGSADQAGYAKVRAVQP